MLRKLQLVDDAAMRAIECTVGRAIRRGRFKACDFKDLVQDAVVELLENLDGFDPTRSSWSTYCTLIARNFVGRKAKRKGVQEQVDSLQDSVDSGDDTPLEEVVENRHLSGRCGCPAISDQERIELREDLPDFLDRLPEPLREFGQSYLENSQYSKVADSLGVSRFTVYRRRNLLRQFVAEESLHEYRY